MLLIIILCMMLKFSNGSLDYCDSNLLEMPVNVLDHTTGDSYEYISISNANSPSDYSSFSFSTCATKCYGHYAFVDTHKKCIVYGQTGPDTYGPISDSCYFDPYTTTSIVRECICLSVTLQNAVTNSVGVDSINQILITDYSTRYKYVDGDFHGFAIIRPPNGICPCFANAYDGGSNTCLKLTPPCSSSEYEYVTPTATSNRVCSALTTCSSSEYESTSPTATSDRVCSALTTCSSSQYQSTAPTATSNRVCSALTTCSSSQYQSTSPTATSNRVCSVVAPPCLSSEYESVAPTATNDRVCSAVTTCSSSEYESAAPTATSDRVCKEGKKCTVVGDNVVFGLAYSDIKIYRQPTWKTYKMDRNIVKTGNYTGKLRLMETIWDEVTPKCRCYSSENELPLKAQGTSSLFTVDTGEFVPTWDKSLFYNHNHKNPFVCNYESYSEYGGMTSDSCGCGDELALAEMQTTFATISKRTITYEGSDVPGDTLAEKLQYCAKSCKQKLFISEPSLFHTSGWLLENDADMFTMATSGPLTGQCICFKKSDADEEAGICPDTEFNCLGKFLGTYSDGVGNYRMNKLQGKQRCEQQGYRLCKKYDISQISLCNYGWLEDEDRAYYWRESAATGCGSGGWLSSGGNNNAHCCERPPGGYKTYKILSGCSCAGKFLLNHEKVDCPSGSFNAGSCRDTCPQCPRGYYQKDEGRISCDICPQGYFQDRIGADSCKACTNHCWKSGQAGAGTVGTCVPGSVTDTTFCEACTTNHLHQNQNVFLTLGMTHSHGSYTPKKVLVDSGEVCIACPLGWSDAYFEGCERCAVGRYGIRGIQGTCLACPAGFYQSKEGQTECTACDGGKYQSEEGKSSCIGCPVGKAREAYFPHNDNIMKRQGASQECLTCGSMGLDAEQPGCVYCNQYQDESGQLRCKRCPMNPSEQWQIYSYVDSNNIPYTKEGSCKYAENLNFWWEHRRVVDPRPDGMHWGGLEWCGSEYTDQPFSSDAEKKQFQNWTACVYASSTWSGRRYSDHTLLEYDDWFGDYNYYKVGYTLQGYDKNCPRKGYSDFYTNTFLNLPCDTTVAELQYTAYRL